jgi:hypothetical protein
MKKLALLIFSLMFCVTFSSAQLMNINLNDQGPTPGSNEIYYVHLYQVDVAGGTPVAISSGADQTFSTTNYPNGVLQVYFSAGIPNDEYEKIYRVKFKIQRRLNVPPYTVIVRGDPDYSEWCNSDMFYSAIGFTGYGILN